MINYSPSSAASTTARTPGHTTFFGRAALAVAAAATAVLVIVSPSAASPLAAPLPEALAATANAPVDAPALSLEEGLLNLLNADRAAHGLAPLAHDPELAHVARWRSEDMAARDYFSHDIGGYQVFSVLKDQGISYRVAGENLAYNYYGLQDTAARAQVALMNSPTHRANILRADYTSAGIGASVAPDGRVLFTQLFRQSW